MTLTLETDLESVYLNHRAKYLGRRLPIGEKLLFGLTLQAHQDRLL